MKVMLSLACILFLSLMGCKTETNQSTEDETNQPEKTTTSDPFFNLSLAQWSLNQPIRNGEMNPLDFPKIASELGFDGVEYVNTLYATMLQKYDSEEEGMQALVDSLNERSKEYDIRNVLIMIDAEGNLSAANEEEQNTAVENHKKWVDAASDLGCHSLRVNLPGAGDEEAWKKHSIAGLNKLATYAATKNINIIVENHGGFSSNAALLMEVINTVDKENCGTLPDFGNFCLGGGRIGPACDDEYDVYKGVKEMMPKAKGVSAKSYEFNDSGEETSLDYERLLTIVKESGFDGFIGVEYEGGLDDPKEGIRLTKELLLSTANKID